MLFRSILCSGRQCDGQHQRRAKAAEAAEKDQAVSRNSLHQPATGGRREDQTTAINRKVLRSGTRAGSFRDVGKLGELLNNPTRREAESAAMIAWAKR